MNPANWKPVGDLTSWFSELTENCTRTEAKGARSLAILVVWSIWCERNRRVFNDEVKAPDKIVEEIKDTSRLWTAAGAQHLASLVDEPICE